MTVPVAEVRAALDRVRAALDRAGEGGARCYLIRGGAIAAALKGGAIAASAPFPWPGEVVAPGSELEEVVARMPGDLDFAVDADHLTIRSGRFKGRIKLEREPGWTPEPPDASGAVELSPDHAARLRALLPFVADPGAGVAKWMEAVVFQRGRACAVSAGATIFAMTSVPDLGLDALVPKPALVAAFAGAAPRRMAATDKWAAFWWDDGSWLRSQLVTGKVPAALDGFAEKAVAGAAAPEIAPEWREAFARVGGFAAGTIELRADKMLAGRGESADVEDGVGSPTPAEGGSRWSAAHLAAVVAEADRFDPSAWPNPAPFSGPRLRGLIVGQR